MVVALKIMIGGFSSSFQNSFHFLSLQTHRLRIGFGFLAINAPNNHIGIYVQNHNANSDAL
jgi:hypothetical protein